MDMLIKLYGLPAASTPASLHVRKPTGAEADAAVRWVASNFAPPSWVGDALARETGLSISRVSRLIAAAERR
jgi:hypothetical protein